MRTKIVCITVNIINLNVKLYLSAIYKNDIILKILRIIYRDDNFSIINDKKLSFS